MLNGANYTNISGADEVAVSPRPGRLVGIAINTPIADATIAVYDGEDEEGTLIASITLPADVGAMPPSSLLYDVAYSTGLFVVTTGASLDVTVCWR